MGRPKFGLDLDGVVYQFSKTAQYMIARREGYKYREELPWDETEWDCGRPLEDWEWILSEERADAAFRHGHLYRGAIEFVQGLDELGDVHIITKRPRDGVQATLDFLSFQKFPITGLHLIGLEELKSSVQADIYIDDSLENMNDLADHTGSQLILMNRSWNQNWNREDRLYRVNRFYRAYDFDAALGKVVKWLKPGQYLVTSEEL